MPSFIDLAKEQANHLANEGPQKDPRLASYSKIKDGVKEVSSDFDNTDKILLAAFEAMNAADWSQTQQAQRSPDRYIEDKFPGGVAELIGSHPSRDKITALMATEAIGVPYLAQKLPSGFRKALLSGLIAAKMSAVGHNKNVGLDVIRW